MVLKHRHTHTRIQSHIQFVSLDQQSQYELQFVVLCYYKRRKDGLHSNNRKCFSLELKAEIINEVDMKRKTKVQICRDYKISSETLYYTFLKDKEAIKQSEGSWVPFILLTNKGSNWSNILVIWPLTAPPPNCISLAETCQEQGFSSGTKSSAIAMHCCNT